MSSPLDPDNPVAALVVEGMQAEAAGRPDAAAELFGAAWHTCSTSAESAVAAHYVARHQATPRDALAWNQRALDEAARSDPALVAGWLPSLHLNLGRSWEDVGDLARAREQYLLAEAAAPALDEDGYGQLVRGGIANGLARTAGDRPRPDVDADR